MGVHPVLHESWAALTADADVVDDDGDEVKTFGFKVASHARKKIGQKFYCRFLAASRLTEPLQQLLSATQHKGRNADNGKRI